MKILHVTESLRSVDGGVARCVQDLANYQAKQDATEVSVWSVIGGDLERNLECVSIPKGGIEEVLKGKDWDVVHIHGIWMPILHKASALCKVMGITVVASPHGMLEPWCLNHKRWKKKLAWYLYQKRDLQSVSALHATALSEESQFRKLGLSAPVVLAANGVQIPELTDLWEGNSEGGERNLSNNHQDRTALFLSRVHPKKGLPMLIDAWAKVNPEGWNMRVVGPDEAGHRNELKEQLRKCGLENCWYFEDSLEGDEKWKAMMKADLFVLPTHSENFGIVVAEALAVGTPVLTTTGAPWEGLLERECGWWVDPTVDALARALEEACSCSEDQRRSMGLRGREWVKNEFSWDKIAQEMIKFYRGLGVPK